MILRKNKFAVSMIAFALCCHHATAQQPLPLVVQAKKVITATGQTIENGSVVCVDGKIKAIGKTGEVVIPEKATIVQSEVAMPGMIDVRTCAGLSGILNVDQDNDHLESSSPLQPELRTIDAYNPREELVEYIRSFGVTTIHTGHAPGELMSGQTLIAKTIGNSIDEALIVDGRAIAATLAESSSKSGKSSPGTRGKQMAMLRSLFIEAQELQTKIDAKANPKPAGKLEDDKDKESDKEKKSDPIARNLRLESVMQILAGKKALLITADRAGYRVRDSLGRRVQDQNLAGQRCRCTLDDSTDQACRDQRFAAPIHGSCERRKRESVVLDRIKAESSPNTVRHPRWFRTLRTQGSCRIVRSCNCCSAWTKLRRSN